MIAPVPSHQLCRAGGTARGGAGIVVSSTHPHNPKEWGSSPDKTAAAAVGFLDECEAPQPQGTGTVTATAWLLQGTAPPGWRDSLQEPSAPQLLCSTIPVPLGSPHVSQGGTKAPWTLPPCTAPNPTALTPPEGPDLLVPSPLPSAHTMLRAGGHQQGKAAHQHCPLCLLHPGVFLFLL